MATAAKVIERALKLILVQGSEAPLEADEYNDAIFAMNNLMLDYDADGISLGYTEVSDLGDEITIPPGALRGLIANLALEVAPDYGGIVSNALVNAATNGLKTMRKLGQIIPTSAYPSTLPIGSGNEHDAIWRDGHFYDNLQAEILAETTGAVGLETNTASES